MIKGQKNLVLFIVILEAALIAALTVSGFKKAKDNLALKLQLKSKEETLSGKDSAIKELEKQTAEMKAARQELEARVKDLNDTAKALEGKLQGSKEATEALAKQFGQQKKELLERFNNISSENKKTFSVLYNKISQLLRTKESLEKQLQSLQQDNSVDETAPTEPANNKKRVDLGKISVSNNPLDYPKSSLDYNYAGNVLDVDNEFNFIIVDLDQENGVKPGSKFAVIRSRRKIGEIILKEIYKGMSLAEPIADSTPNRLRRGDKLIPIR